MNQAAIDRGHLQLDAWARPAPRKVMALMEAVTRLRRLDPETLSIDAAREEASALDWLIAEARTILGLPAVFPNEVVAAPPASAELVFVA